MVAALPQRGEEGRGQGEELALQPQPPGDPGQGILEAVGGDPEGLEGAAQLQAERDLGRRGGRRGGGGTRCFGRGHAPG